MVRKLLSRVPRYVEGKMVDPNSMLYRLVVTSSNIENATDLMKRNYIVLSIVLILSLFNTIYCIWSLRSSFLLFGSVLYFLLFLWSLFSFILSTNYEYFNFWKRKKYVIFIVILSFLFFVISIISKLFCSLILPLLLMIPINRDITVGMVVWLCRVVYLIILAVPTVYVGVHMVTAVYDEKYWPKIESFKIRKYIDFRDNKEHLYDLNIIKKMSDGTTYTIKEKDRQRHMLLSGVTGTGKTSSALVPAVASDLDRKAENEDYCKKQLLARIISKKDIYADSNITDENYNISMFHPYTKEGEDFINDLIKKSPSAGITVVAPNADFADAVYELATSRGFKVNRVDPIPKNPATWEMKPGFIGFNPLYISPDLPENVRKIEIFRKSRMFSDVLQALYDQGSKSDPYFSSLNRNFTTIISILVMTTYPWLHDGEQPDVSAVQEVINDFTCVRQYLYALAKIVGIGDNLHGEGDITADWLRAHKFGEYQFIVSQVANDLLGAGRTKMEDQARGLRTIINEFLTDPYIKNILCCGSTVDIDRTLSNGEITVVNYGLELGMSIATGFGLFYCLSFNQAVLRRSGNEETRLLHFYYCDEFPVLMHKDMEQIFTLFRQYKVCFTCAFQTFSQFDRNDVTRFLKKVILSNVGHHIVYGNCSIEEMELYNKLAGKELRFVEQQTTNETALSLADTSLSYSTRTTPEYADVVDGYKLRNKDFQEVTVFGVNNGDYIPPFDGKLSFLTKKQRDGNKRCIIDWSRYIDDEQKEDVEFTNTFEITSQKTPVVESSAEMAHLLDIAGVQEEKGNTYGTSEKMGSMDETTDIDDEFDYTMYEEDDE